MHDDKFLLKTPLSVNLEINNERQDCESGTVVGGTCRGRGNEGDEGEGIWLMDFIYEKEQ
jgi:hypothetical protein